MIYCKYKVIGMAQKLNKKDFDKDCLYRHLVQVRLLVTFVFPFIGEYHSY